MSHYYHTTILLLLLATAATAAGASSSNSKYHYYVHRSSGVGEGLFDGMVADSGSPAPSPAPFGSPPPDPSVSPPPEDNNSNWSPDKYQRIVYRGLQTAPACNALRYGSCLGQALNVQKKCDYLNRSCIR
ncbi:unnamed protein product [Cuscuta campestris]|uniref:Uncharacterized protein n=1 Tax=Cuscuta campestris TaxID=132261 RepID=A0A484KVA3_9ASTE|nr:unnamed protein product [Cuscuta campestris]